MLLLGRIISFYLDANVKAQTKTLQDILKILNCAADRGLFCLFVVFGHRKFDYANRSRPSIQDDVWLPKVDVDSWPDQIKSFRAHTL